MKTHPIGPDTANVPVNLPKGMKAELDALARKSGVTTSEYLRGILVCAIDSEATVTIHTSKKPRINLVEYKVALHKPIKSDCIRKFKRAMSE